jgi:large subunit ribosomal protein L9
MSTTEVLLIKPVDGLGAEGEQVRVKSGYARNFLLPQGIALPVNRANKKYLESLSKARVAREARDLEVATDLAKKIQAASLVFSVKTGEGGKMFGAISVPEIIAKLGEQGVQVDRKRVHLGQGPVKLLGKHVAHVKLHADIAFELPFEIVSENPIVEAAEAPEEESRDEGFKKPRRPKREAKSE